MSRGSIQFKWLEERGFNVLADKHQYSYCQSLWASPSTVQAVFVEAKAGCGKTALAAMCGAYALEKGEYDRMIYIRNTVSIRDQGFLPGDLAAKEAPFMEPFIQSLEKVQPGYFEKYSKPDALKKTPAKVFTASSSFARGITWDNAFIIIDEAQSFDLDELQAVYTRCSDTCKIVTLGSLRQIDNKKLRRYAGLTPFELYMEHFRGTNSTYHKLETNYRGFFSDHADNIADTIKKLTEVK